jgi:hypothetical protein
MMLQLQLAVGSYNPARSRELKLSSLKQHALKVFNEMASTIQSSVVPRQDEKPSALLLFGGYSWFRKAFQLWQIEYRPKVKTFVASSAAWIGYREEYKSVGFAYAASPGEAKKISQIAVIGDEPNVKIAKHLLRARVKRNASERVFHLNMEPFEVIRDMLRDADPAATIGGPPQVVIVHQFLQTMPVGIYWPDKKSGSVCIQGRKTLGYENIDRYILDPDTLDLESPSRNAVRELEKELPPIG